MQTKTNTLKIVIIEDNPDNLEVARELILTDIGAKSCVCCSSGVLLFSHLRMNANQPIALILLDLQLPLEDGYALLKRLLEQKRWQPALKETKIVALTANVMPQDVARAQQAGFDGFIGKPIDIMRFPEQISRVLEGESVWEPR